MPPAPQPALQHTTTATARASTSVIQLFARQRRQVHSRRLHPQALQQHLTLCTGQHSDAHHWLRRSLVRRPSLACATAAPAAFTHSSIFASSSAQHHRITAQLRHSTASRAAAAPSRADTFPQVQDPSEGFFARRYRPKLPCHSQVQQPLRAPRGRADCTRTGAPPAEQQRHSDAASLLHVAADTLQQRPPHFSISVPSRAHLVAVRRCGHHYVRHTQVQLAARAPRQQSRPPVHASLLSCTREQQPLTRKLTPSTADQQSQHLACGRISTASVSHRSIARRTHQVCSTHAPASALSARTHDS